jgi:hypothetical protein
MGDETMINNRIEWRTSTYSNNGTCVEVANLDEAVLVRDTKDRNRRPVRWTPGVWQAFVAGVKSGEFE